MRQKAASRRDTEMQEVATQDLTLAEFAQVSKVSYQTALGWVRRGLVPNYRIGKTIRIPAGTLEEMRQAAKQRFAESTAKK